MIEVKDAGKVHIIWRHVNHGIRFYIPINKWLHTILFEGDEITSDIIDYLFKEFEIKDKERYVFRKFGGHKVYQ